MDRDFDAVLLAGGKSARFGRDKAFLEWRGEPLYRRQLAKLAQLRPRRLWVSANRSQSFRDLPPETTVVVDDAPDLGPLGGLLSVFRESRARALLVLGVDLPLMEPSFLGSLLERGFAASGPPAPPAVVPLSGGRWEPLAALYPREEMLALLEASAQTGCYRLQTLLDEASAAGWVLPVAVAEEEALYFTNLNTPTDLPDREAAAAARRGGLRGGESSPDEEVPIRRFRLGGAEPEVERTVDAVAAEAPLEIRVNGRSVAVTMRTPGHDEDLATGFLVTEGVVTDLGDLLSLSRAEELDRESAPNVIEVRLAQDPDFEQLTRHVFTSSSCGVCGKATLDSVFRNFPPVPEGAAAWRKGLDAAGLVALPKVLRAAQETFDRTGGLHASALFSPEGRLLLLREDVGRHNALDKVVGTGLREGLDFGGTLLLVSGRISFELMQKALSAGIPLVAGISAPSSLAVSLARRSGQTLVGFLRERGFNHYAGPLGESDGPETERPA